jgi:hypothetical protein
MGLDANYGPPTEPQQAIEIIRAAVEREIEDTAGKIPVRGERLP